MKSRTKAWYMKVQKMLAEKAEEAIRVAAHEILDSYEYEKLDDNLSLVEDAKSSLRRTQSYSIAPAVISLWNRYGLGPTMPDDLNEYVYLSTEIQQIFECCGTEEDTKEVEKALFDDDGEALHSFLKRITGEES